MISLQDCIGLCGLTPDEIDAIAVHEHVPDVVAAAMASYLLQAPHGLEKVRDMIIDDIKSARAGDDPQKAARLLHTLHHFLRAHPDVPLR
jgi:hypothetical protein